MCYVTENPVYQISTSCQCNLVINNVINNLPKIKKTCDQQREEYIHYARNSGQHDKSTLNCSLQEAFDTWALYSHGNRRESESFIVVIRERHWHTMAITGIPRRYRSEAVRWQSALHSCANHSRRDTDSGRKRSTLDFGKHGGLRLLCSFNGTLPFLLFSLNWILSL